MLPDVNSEFLHLYLGGGLFTEGRYIGDGRDKTAPTDRVIDFILIIFSPERHLIFPVLLSLLVV
jgi:hypothetical protein